MSTTKDMREQYDAELDRLEKKLQDIKASLMALVPEDSELMSLKAKKPQGLAGFFGLLRHA